MAFERSNIYLRCTLRYLVGVRQVTPLSQGILIESAVLDNLSTTSNLGICSPWPGCRVECKDKMARPPAYLPITRQSCQLQNEHATAIGNGIKS